MVTGRIELTCGAFNGMEGNITALCLLCMGGGGGGGGGGVGGRGDHVLTPNCNNLNLFTVT